MREVCSGGGDRSARPGLLAADPRGRGPSDYERYLRTDELLALQKTAEEWAHHDELLFQTVHQSSELWLKLAVEGGRGGDRAPRRAARSRRRCGCCAVRASASSTRPRSSTCSSRCRRGSTRRSGRCSATAAASTRPASARCAACRRCWARRSTRLRERPGSRSSRCTCAAASTRSCTSSPRRCRVGRAGRDLAHPALQGRRAHHRRRGRRHAGHARRGARAADPQELLSRSSGRSGTS